MQYIDNDMDELFEKAGRDYPLKTDNSGWDAVFGKLQQPDPGITAPNPKPSNKKYYWLLLLLLPVGYLLGDGLIEKKNAKSGLNKEKNLNKKLLGATANNVSESQHNLPKFQHDLLESQQNQLKSQRKITIMKPSLNTSSREPRKNIRGLHHVLSPQARRKWTVSSSGQSEVAKRNEDGSADEKTMTRPPVLSRIPINYFYIKPSININISSIPTPTPPQPKLRSIPTFYAGFITGPDLSTIKYQQVNNLGYSVGFVFGYNISRKFSLEAGVLYSKKKYYTEGKYFDQAKAGIPSSVYIHDLSGGCNMFEVPLSVKYNFSTKPNTLFATAGLTSYFMKQENYNYKAYTGGSYYDGYKSYKNSGNHFLSNMQLSIGYNYQLSRKISLRAEPYIKIPVNKIGIGNMPITSTGVYFGIIKNIKQ